jgi:hypothetical protein
MFVSTNSLHLVRYVEHSAKPLTQVAGHKTTSHRVVRAQPLARRTLWVRRFKLWQLSRGVRSQHLQLPSAEVPIYNPE